MRGVLTIAYWWVVKGGIVKGGVVDNLPFQEAEADTALENQGIRSMRGGTHPTGMHSC